MKKIVRILGIFSIMLLLGLFGQLPTQAANFTVSDEAGLVQAIIDANATPELDIIELTADINLTTTTTYYLLGDTGLPVITAPLMLQGNGYTIRRTSITNYRILAATSTQVWIENIKIANGYLSSGIGGAIYVDGTGSQLTLMNTTIGGSSADANVASIYGGGVYVEGDLTVVDSIISHNEIRSVVNRGRTRGGGISVRYGIVSIINTSITDNTMYNSSNSGGYPAGGGIHVDTSESMYVINSEISRNALYNVENGGGGGLGYIGDGDYPAEVVIINTVFDTNSIQTTGNSSAYATSGGASISRQFSYEQYRLNVSVYNSQFTNNTITTEYGSIWNSAFTITSSNVLIDGVNVSNNGTVATNRSRVTSGNAGINGYETIQIRNTSIVNNLVSTVGAYLSSDPLSQKYVSGLSFGNIPSSEIILENVTISGNRYTNSQYSTLAVSAGLRSPVDVTVVNSTISDNRVEMPAGSINASAGLGVLSSTEPVSIANTIISGNYISNIGVITQANCETLDGISLGYNIIEPDGNCELVFTDATDILSTVAMQPLVLNSGDTFTHEITTTPPINSANNANCPLLDQRRAIRDGQCDIGAYEANASSGTANGQPLANDDSYLTQFEQSISYNILPNDTDPDGDPVYAFLASLPSSGVVRLFPTGQFFYTPLTGFTGVDTFQYQVCDIYGDCSSTATVTIEVDGTLSAPATPTNLRMADNAYNSIILVWDDNVADETLFSIEHSWDATNWQVIGQVTANIVNFTDLNLICDTDHLYRVTAYRASDNLYSAPSNVLNASTSLCPPPGNLQATPVNYSSIMATWDDIATDESGYSLYFSSDNGINWYATSGTNASSNLDANTISYELASLICETDYLIKVNSFRGSITERSESAITPVTTGDCPSPPLAPTNLHTTLIESFKIDLAWDDNATNETLYYLEISDDGGITWTESTLNANIISTSVSNLTCETEYHFRVRAWLDYLDVYGDYSNELVVSADTCPPPPLTPTDLWNTLSSNGSTVRLRWVDNATDENSYEIERSADNGSTWDLIKTSSANTIVYTMHNVTCGTEFLYRVRAFRNLGGSYSDYSNIHAYSVVCYPTNIIVTATSPYAISITWDDNSDDESIFNLNRTPNFTPTSWIEVPANSTSYVDSGLTCGSSYRYRVQAYRSSPEGYGTSSYSNYVTLTCPPETPDSLIAIQTGITGIDLAWNDNATTESNYRVIRTDSGGSSWDEIAFLPADSISYTDNTVVCGTNYDYAVRAYDSSINWDSYPTNVASVFFYCDPPATPSNLIISSSELNALNLQWGDNAISESAYLVERSDDGGTNWQEIVQLASDTVEYRDVGLTCSTNLDHRVRAYDSATGFYSEYSNIISGTTSACQPPADPTGLTISNSAIDRISITWLDNSSIETDYFVERSDDGGTTWEVVTQLTPNSTSYTNIGLDCQTGYAYRVRAYDSINDMYSLYSNVVSGATALCDSDFCTFSEFDPGFTPVAGDSISYIYGYAFLSANGNRIAIHRGFPAQSLLIYDVATETIIDEITGAGGHDIDADGSHMIIGSSADLTGQNFDMNPELFIWNNGAITQITNTSGTGIYYSNARISDDGNTVVFMGRGAVVGESTTINYYYRWDLTNGIQKLIPDSFTGSILTSPIVISGDGTTIAYIYGNDIYLWDAVNGARSMASMVDSTGQLMDIQPYSLNINYDGSRVTFTATNDYVGQNADHSSELYLWEDGVGLLQLTDTTLDATWGVAMDGAGGRILLGDAGNINATNPDGNGEYFFFDDGYGYQQISDTNYLGTITLGSNLSHDGSRAVIIMPNQSINEANAQADPNTYLYPYLRLYIADCAPPPPIPDYPYRPSNLLAEQINNTEISLSWTDTAINETAYLVESSTNNGVTWTEIVRLQDDSTSYVDNSVICDTNYMYRVRAYNANSSLYSNYSNLVNLASVTCPTISISGVVLSDYDASPLDDVLVGFADVATGTVAGFTCTAVDGSYVLDSSTVAPPEAEVVVFAAGDDEASTACDETTAGLYYREWFDNVFDPGTATILDLSISDTASNVDFSLTQVGTAGTPIVTAPSGLIVDTRPDLVWNTVLSASAYDVYLTGPAEYTALLTTVQSDAVCTGAVCTYLGTNFTEALPVGNYALFIRGRNPLAETGAWSSSMQFQIAPPTQPFITSPSGSVTENPPTIVWTEGETAFSYDLYLTGGDYSNIWTVNDTACDGSGSCSTPVPDVLSGGVYAVFVRAENEIGLTAWSPQYSFTIQPDAPVFLSPQGTLTDEFRPEYQWQSLDGVTAYSLYVTGPGTSLFLTYDATTVCDAGLCSVNPGNDLNQDLLYGVHATWVQSRVGAAKSDWSNGLVFTVVPGIPQLSAPVSPTSDNTPDFVWAIVTGATSYDIYLTGSGVSHLQNYDAATYCDALICTVDTGLTLSDGVYAAYVLSRNGTTKGDWSSIWSFEVSTAAPLAEASGSQLDILPSAEVTVEPQASEDVTETPIPTDEATMPPETTEIATDTPIPTEVVTETPIPTDEATETPIPTEVATEIPIPTDEATVPPETTDTVTP